jgi:hypothetical protein
VPSKEVRRLTAVQMDVVATTRRSVAIALAVVVALMLVLLAWIGGEQHYRACLERVALEYPAVSAQSSPPARAEAIDDCSRFP